MTTYNAKEIHNRRKEIGVKETSIHRMTVRETEGKRRRNDKTSRVFVIIMEVIDVTKEHIKDKHTITFVGGKAHTSLRAAKNLLQDIATSNINRIKDRDRTFDNYSVKSGCAHWNDVHAGLYTSLYIKELKLIARDTHVR